MTGSYEIKWRSACNLPAVYLKSLTKTIFSVPQSEFMSSVKVQSTMSLCWESVYGVG